LGQRDKQSVGESSGEAAPDCFLTLQFMAEDLPALGHTHYYLRYVEDGGDTPESPATVTTTKDSIENEHYRVRLYPNGMLDVFDKATGTEYRGLNRLEDTEDIGDEYDYSPAADSETITAEDCTGQLRILEQNNLSGRIEAEFTLRLPESIDPSRRRRSTKRVDCGAATRVCLKQGSRLIEIEQLLDNRAKDHRLRAEFPTLIETDTVISDGHFYLNHRPIERPSGADWVQPPSGTYPQQNFSALQDGKRGLAVLGKGLPEIEATRGKAGHAKLSLTLLRAVGWLSRDDFPTRRCSNAGPTIHTPDAQCLGTHTFQYALVPFGGDCIAADIKGLSRRYNTPVLVVQGVEDQHIEGGSGLLKKATRSTSITAVKKHEVRDTLIVRLYNLAADPVEETLILGMRIADAWRTDLLEERIGRVAVGADGRIPVRLRPHEIVTVEIGLDLRSPNPHAFAV
jgi:alpha-mannosidase